MKGPLDHLRLNVFSQNGEDGIIQALVQKLGFGYGGNCVEFGAWDGIKYSNTFNLVKNYNWKALYIEGDSEKYLKLLDTVKENENITPYQSWITFEKDSDSLLDKILLDKNIDSNFDILSIDIDSFDLEIWKSLTSFFPKIVIIEINSSIPPGVKQTHSETGLGGSFSSTLEVGIEKGYRLVCHTGNMIFLRNDLVPLIDFDDIFFTKPELLFDWSWVPKKVYWKVKFLKWSKS